ncbi:MAG TPA: hypothetical protein DD412_05030 [Holosporales bacterium]|nr:hypothetical protein [Holosporales bacterium]
MATITLGATPNLSSAVTGLDKGSPLSGSNSQKAGGASGGAFADLVKGVANETLEASKAADQASVAAVHGKISDLELVHTMKEAEISLQRFKSVYERTKESLDKILNMNI